MYWFRNAIIYQLTKQIDFENIEKQLTVAFFIALNPARLGELFITPKK
ncbi:hypothetical protein [Haemophilus influenzae]|nr:hypothetical protein [Haemophilus influenzae]